MLLISFAAKRALHTWCLTIDIGQGQEIVLGE
jgi:hypothetical protein